ncbi:MAG: polysaccharide biosynthesis protein [Marinilabiliales bacterium]|nr:MAG: polysaccharide biosynthesis protein [Marinilabiliales bacterium]
MGIIKKQSISGTIYSYIGVVLGFITIGILYPRIFNTEEVGLLRILVSYAVLFSQFAGLGINTVTVKLFPYFRYYDNKHHGYLGLALLVSTVGMILSLAIYLIFKSYILTNADESDLFNQYYYYVVPLIIFSLLFTVFDTYYRVLYNAVKGIIYKEVIQRVFILLAIGLFYFELIDFKTTVILYCLAIITPTILLFLSLIYNKQLFLKPELGFIDKKMSREMLTVGFYGILASFSGVLVLNIDVIMVERMMDLSWAGIYTITFFFGTLILIPLRTMGKISSVVIADAWKRDDITTIDDIYKKSSITLSVLGVLLFVGIWGNIDNIFSLIKDEYLPGKMVILYIGLANLLDISVGVSPHIIVNSRYYKYLSYFLIGFAILLIITNLMLIPIYGIVGAAIASLISKFIFNLVKYLFLYRKFKLQPFNIKFLYLIIIGVATYYISTLLPAMSNFVIDIIIRSLLISIVFIVPVFMLKISDDLNGRIVEILRRFGSRNNS